MFGDGMVWLGFGGGVRLACWWCVFCVCGVGSEPASAAFGIERLILGPSWADGDGKACGLEVASVGGKWWWKKLVVTGS